MTTERSGKGTRSAARAVMRSGGQGRPGVVRLRGFVWAISGFHRRNLVLRGAR